MAMRRSVLATILAAAAFTGAGSCVEGDAGCLAADEQSLVQIRPHSMLFDGPHPHGAEGMDSKTCKMESGDCPLQRMLRGEINHVYPGGDTACLDPSKPYFFQVRRGSRGKLLYWFDDGGICGNQAMFLSKQFCTEEPWLTAWSGVLNHSDARNPYHDYTMVRVSYCSGDSFSGNITQQWGLNGEDVKISGSANAEAVLEWTRTQFPALHTLVIAGSSAGSIALQGWANRVIDRLQKERTRIIVHADSFPGLLFPVGQINLVTFALHQAWGSCSSIALSLDFKVACENGTLTSDQLFRSAMRTHPHAHFSMINSKVDKDQIRYSSVLANRPVMPAELYKEMTLLLKAFAQEPNFRSYLVDGEFHTFLRMQELFTATPLGAAGGGNGTVLSKWLQGFATCQWHSPVPENTCEGRQVNVTEAGDPESPADYCDPALVGEGEAR